MKIPLRVESIKSKLTTIEESLNFIKENLPDNAEEFKGSKMIRNALYKEVEYIIQLTIDICSIINSDLRLGTPENEEDIVNIVEKNKVVSKHMAINLKSMKGFRNLLVHQYGEINDETAFENIHEGLKDFEMFIEEIELFIEKNKQKRDKK